MDSFNIQNYFKRGKTVVLTLRQGDDEGARQWSDKETNELLKHMNVFLPEFQNHRRRKKDVWEDVSKGLQNSGYPWTSEECRKKWSNMIRTFRVIEEQRQDPMGNKRVKWPFYDYMYQLLSMSGSDAFPESGTVVQLLKPTGSSSSGIYSRKVTPYKTSFAPPNMNAPLHATLMDSLHAGVPSQPSSMLHLGHDTDDMGMGVVSDHPGSGEVDSLEGNLMFDEPIRFSRPETQATTPSLPNKSKSTLHVRPRKKPFRRKAGKYVKKTTGETIDDVLAKFIDETNKQNELMMEKLTSFHSNVVTLMQERNDLLREIRDSLQQEARNTADGGLNEGMGEEGHVDTETLTLQMGPAYSTNGTSATQLNSTLVISEAAAASALSSFQIVEDGTVLTSLDGAECLNEVSLLHPTLVSVVHDVTSSQPELDPNPKQEIIK